LIWHEMMRLREKKPVIASIGGMAASGGYYIACAADRIVAERTSIVGSIGVFGGKFVVGEALEELGVTSFAFPASEEPGAASRALFMSPLTPWDDATRAKVDTHMRHIYDLFLRRVATGRKLPLEHVSRNAEGAIFTARQGKERKLVDDLGGLALALDIARKRAKLDLDAPVVVEGLRESLIEALFVSEEPSAGEVEAAVLRARAERKAWQDLLPREMHPFIGSLMPLAQGEHTLAALPFVLVVR
jgi:protease-4